MSVCEGYHTRLPKAMPACTVVQTQCHLQRLHEERHSSGCFVGTAQVTSTAAPVPPAALEPPAAPVAAPQDGHHALFLDAAPDIWAAVESKDHQSVLNLLHEIPDRATIVRPVDGFSLLHLAASIPANHDDNVHLAWIMGYLMNHDADLALRNVHGRTALEELNHLAQSNQVAEVLFRRWRLTHPGAPH